MVAPLISGRVVGGGGSHSANKKARCNRVWGGRPRLTAAAYLSLCPGQRGRRRQASASAGVAAVQTTRLCVPLFCLLQFLNQGNAVIPLPTLQRRMANSPPAEAGVKHLPAQHYARGRSKTCNIRTQTHAHTHTRARTQTSMYILQIYEEKDKETAMVHTGYGTVLWYNRGRQCTVQIASSGDCQCREAPRAPIKEADQAGTHVTVRPAKAASTPRQLESMKMQAATISVALSNDTAPPRHRGKDKLRTGSEGVWDGVGRAASPTPPPPPAPSSVQTAHSLPQYGDRLSTLTTTWMSIATECGAQSWKSPLAPSGGHEMFPSASLATSPARLRPANSG